LIFDIGSSFICKKSEKKRFHMLSCSRDFSNEGPVAGHFGDKFFWRSIALVSYCFLSAWKLYAFGGPMNGENDFVALARCQHRPFYSPPYVSGYCLPGLFYRYIG